MTIEGSAKECLGQFRPYEQALRMAQLTNEVDVLDALLDDDLVFVGADGNAISKQDDLSMHRQRRLPLLVLDMQELQAQRVDAMIWTTAKSALVGRFDAATIGGNYAYPRLWRGAGGHRRVVAGQVARLV